MASSSSSSPSAPTFSSKVWKYHVFLSFRGEDTRKTFVDHLYTALEQQGIHTYKDDETLARGDSIGPSLMTAIKESQIAVIVFSKNYADSSWCLDELEYIMKCKDTNGLIVIPIFYDVDLSEVRHQEHKYREAFVKHELQNKNKVDSWRKALVDASNVSGWETECIANGHESKCIKKIVDTISHRLHPINSSIDDNLVGVEARMQDLISKLQIGFGGKRMIGIWGVGGGGKTTLASSIYDEISSKFDGCCFIKSVREESSNKNGLENLQEKIICDVLKQKEVEVGRVEEGRHLINDRLQHRKVLIVLDDVDHLDQLKALAGSHDWFGDGSRIIITTRDEHVLTAHKVDMIHTINLLNTDEAMKLFCKHATPCPIPIDDFAMLSKDVVSYAGGLPLALRVLGCFLCDKNMNEWRSALDRLKEIPDVNILQKLKISFDGLTPLEKELFLDIACFFRSKEKKEWVTMILDVCGFYSVIGIKVLVQKALITISEDGEFDMHDLLQEMAHHIVRGEHPNNPEKHSRVWKKEDVLKICAMDTTTNLDKIEAIDVCLRSDESQRVLQVAANMKKLRSIDLEDFKGLFENKIPLMPEKFPPWELCCLSLSGLPAKQLWEGYKYLPNLKMMKFVCLRNLIKTPDFEGLPNLERFTVDGSPLLEEIHPSFGHLEKLVYVVIQDCANLKRLPVITRSKKLEIVVLSRCKNVYYLSNIQQNLQNFQPHSMNHIGVWFFSGCLRKLHLSWCNLVDRDIQSSAGWVLPNLKELNLIGNCFVRLDFSLWQLPRLQYLFISYCKELVELSELPLSIAVVIAENCSSLKSLGDISNCKWLWKVSLQVDTKLGPLVADKLLDSMLQANAKDYFICIRLSQIDIWRRGFAVWLDWVKPFTMPLPRDWYNDYCGIMMFVKCNKRYLDIDVTIEQSVDGDFQSEVHQESNETVLKAHYHHTYVGYVSFSSLSHTGCLNSTYNFISFSVDDKDLLLNTVKHMLRVVLIAKDDPMKTTKVATDCSRFWDEDLDHRQPFRIHRDSKSSVKILWKSYCHW